MSKICLITHIADMDGAMPIILAKIVFQKLEVFSCEISEVNDTLTKVINNHQEYEHIYIVDLSISEDLAKTITEDSILSQKISIYDHHESQIHLNKYHFAHIIIEKNNQKECGTTLFYQHLMEINSNPILQKDVLKTIIELVRACDTYDFKSDTEKEMAFKLGNLYNIYGRERFITNYTKFINENQEFYFTEVENTLLAIENERNQRYIDEKLKNVRKAKINDITVGIVFAEQNRSFLGHSICQKFPDIDIAVVINVDRSVSYRADKEEVDVNKIAVFYGGGGHKHAGGSPLPENLQKKICELIYDNIKWND